MKACALVVEEVCERDLEAKPGAVRARWCSRKVESHAQEDIGIHSLSSSPPYAALEVPSLFDADRRASRERPAPEPAGNTGRGSASVRVRERVAGSAWEREAPVHDARISICGNAQANIDRARGRLEPGPTLGCRHERMSPLRQVAWVSQELEYSEVSGAPSSRACRRERRIGRSITLRKEGRDGGYQHGPRGKQGRN